MRHAVTPINQERPFLIEELFFSTTDPAGVITFGNDVFVRVSGYEKDVLVGAPHNIIRHPDMPRCVFWLLWEYLQSGRSIAAYVKNMASDGTYYWVLAFAAPIRGGYLSIRMKPTSGLFATMREAYRELLEIERTVESRGGGRKAAIEASRPHLMAAVERLGYAGYDDLMAEMLLGEIAARNGTKRAPASTGAPGVGATAPLGIACDEVTLAVDGFLEQLGSFRTLGTALIEQVSFVRGLGHELRMLALNAQLRASALGEDGITLRVVSEQMGASAGIISSAANELAQSMGEAITALRAASFRIGTSHLSTEMMSSFLREIAAHHAGADQTRQQVSNLSQVVSANITDACRLASEAAEHIRRLGRRLDEFMKQIRTLEVLHVTGRVEAVRCSQGDLVTSVFGQVLARTQATRQKLSSLTDLTAGARVTLPDSAALARSLETLAGEPAAA